MSFRCFDSVYSTPKSPRLFLYAATLDLFDWCAAQYLQLTNSMQRVLGGAIRDCPRDSGLFLSLTSGHHRDGVGQALLISILLFVCSVRVTCGLKFTLKPG